MKVESFEDLVAWKKARELVNKVYAITKKEKFRKDRALVDQIRRAAISVMSNISEGFERGSNTELIQFLYIAKASCGEVRCQLTVAFDQGYIDKEEFEETHNLARKVSGIIGNFINYLRTSKMKGSKFKPKPRKSWAEEWKEILAKIDTTKPLNP
ncbi:MAG: four helix bundle protein [candidate division Zixibacteria bacterium]|nr:four helix bundle protein [candidate division Zixibacteria bacterium]